MFHSKAYAIRVSVSLNPTHWNCTTNFAFHLKQIKNSLTHTKILTHMHLNHQFFLLSNLNPSLIPPSTPNLNKNKNWNETNFFLLSWWWLCICIVHQLWPFVFIFFLLLFFVYNLAKPLQTNPNYINFYFSTLLQ